MRKILFIFVIVIFLAACQRAAQQPADGISSPAKDLGTTATVSGTSNTGCKCSDEYEPVCANGQVVNNACTADCMGIKNYAKGECNTLTGKQLFPCGETSGGINPQHSNVCGHVTEVDTGVTYWKTYPSSYTACNVYKMGRLEVKEFTRGECG